MPARILRAESFPTVFSRKALICSLVNAILEELSEDAVNNAYVYDQGEDMDFGMRGMS